MVMKKSMNQSEVLSLKINSDSKVGSNCLTIQSYRNELVLIQKRAAIASSGIVVANTNHLTTAKKLTTNSLCRVNPPAKLWDRNLK
jgi:hypothetical protein